MTILKKLMSKLTALKIVTRTGITWQHESRNWPAVSPVSAFRKGEYQPRFVHYSPDLYRKDQIYSFYETEGRNCITNCPAWEPQVIVNDQ